MAIREEAKKSKAFCALLDVYEHREKELLEHTQNGGKAVGVLGADVPEEVLLAAGYMPVRVYADPNKELVHTEVFLERAFEPCARASFEKIVDGTYGSLVERLAISHTSDTELRMWLYLREMRRSERQMPVPPVEFVDWMLSRRRMYQQENRNVVSRFIDAAKAWSGRAIDESDLREQFVVCNDQRAALRQVQALRRADKPRVTGCEALVIIGAGFFMDKAKHASLVRQVAADAASWPELTGPRVFVTGSNHESIDFYEMVEAAGAVVVGEDHDWGDRSYDTDVRFDIDPVLAIVNRYTLRAIGSKRTPVADRVAALDKSAADTKADGVVFYLHEHDEAASWDYPEQRRSLEASGVKSLALFRQLWPAPKNEGLAETVATFVGELKGGRA